MPDVVIKAENLGKRYVIGHQAQSVRYLALREVLAQRARALGRKTWDLARGNLIVEGDTREEVWALQDVSFEIRRGAAVGIIGPNGAGKSTLLKVLSRITEPSAGRVTIRGRVASLLEVGTGFHPELTGRENIYLNGAILGMSRREIRAKFEEIVSFAEVEKFLDTPVKRYSSGMYVRLAFAVAAHLDPEILVIDEVLAVGDAQFQKKCLGKMGSVARGGRTILFVSHHMGAISALCETCLLVSKGRLQYHGETAEAVRRYLGVLSETGHAPLSERKDRNGSGRLRFTEVWVENSLGERVAGLCSGEDLTIVAAYEAAAPGALENVLVAISLRGPFNELLTDLCNEYAGYPFPSLPPRGTIRCTLPHLALNAGRYGFNIFSSVNGSIADWVQNAGEIHVETGNFFGSGRLPGKAWGPFLMPQKWTLQ